MKIHSLLLALAGLLLASTAAADTATLSIAPNTAQAFTITVPADSQQLTVAADVPGGTPGNVVLYLRPSQGGADTGFNLSNDLYSQATYYSASADSKVHLVVVDRQHPSLQQGTWYAVLSNQGINTAQVSLETTIAATPDKTVFQINFDQPSSAVTNALTGGDASKLDCDTAPWHDQTPLDSDGDGDNDTTLGDFRRFLLQQAANNLAHQVHTPIPVKVQACWKAFGNDDDADSYTLAAANATYIFHDVGGGAPANTWYATAPSERLAGAAMCHLDPSIPCDMPDIMVRFNSDNVAQKAYDDATDEPLIISVTMHEITHGLGFLSQVNTGDTSKYEDDLTKDPNFGKLYSG
ncbi:MAG: hypothetical protein L0H70_10645, partial [Xanthomonadales bacterium]|nr:hypothetical protein [Xanthomonadales bacterium]